VRGHAAGFDICKALLDFSEHALTVRIVVAYRRTLLLGGLACQGSNGDEIASCNPGSLYCECVEGQLCLGTLECNAGICVAPGETGDPGDRDPTAA
jgi:hypothetical protein